MKVALILCLVLVGAFGQQQRQEDRNRSAIKYRRCNQIAGLLHKVIQGSMLRSPAPARLLYRKYLGINGGNLREVRRLVCSVIDAKTLKEVADKIPASYDQVKSYYDPTVRNLISRGGYTDAWRYPTIRYDIGKWANSKGFKSNDTKVSNHVDLQTLTDFFHSMQVKYGTQWISGLLDNPITIEDLGITDYKQFAKDLYESDTPGELCERLDGQEGRCPGSILFNGFGWQTEGFEEGFKFQINFRLMELLGRSGLLDLQY